MVRSFCLKDTKALLDIYNYYIIHTIVTFDVKPLTIKELKQKFIKINKNFPFLVFEQNNEILGYAYASTWREKAAYNKSVELTIYIKNGFGGRHIGSKLYKDLLAQLKTLHYHVVLGGITLPNKASIRLHEKFGFKQVAHFKDVGQKFNTWLDVGFWQLLLT